MRTFWLGELKNLGLGRRCANRKVTKLGSAWGLTQLLASYVTVTKSQTINLLQLPKLNKPRISEQLYFGA